ncbi:MAG: hypothetical protein GWP91_20545 [Rhodobacterales bacterium]|nr:hypothetical protein [Rhodobacterales bacterium]
MRLLLISTNLKATSVLAAAALSGSLLAGCGSYWDIRDGDELAYGCVERYFYPDADSDGWGDSFAEGEVLCDPDVERGLTVSNDRDCDDEDDSITGRANANCPVDLLPPLNNVEPAYEGAVFNQSEFVFVYGADTRITNAPSASGACRSWGINASHNYHELAVGQLATFGSQPELAAILDAIRDQAETNGIGIYAGFVGIKWDNDENHLVGAWTFTDDSDDALIQTGLNWCNGEPMPADFFPNLNGGSGERLGVPSHIDAINDALPGLRLTLVLQESGDFCLGLPRDAIPADVLVDIEAGDLSDPFVAELARYQGDEAHFVCKRGKPDPANYVKYFEEPGLSG